MHPELEIDEKSDVPVCFLRRKDVEGFRSRAIRKVTKSGYRITIDRF